MSTGQRRELKKSISSKKADPELVTLQRGEGFWFELQEIIENKTEKQIEQESQKKHPEDQYYKEGVRGVAAAPID